MPDNDTLDEQQAWEAEQIAGRLTPAQCRFPVGTKRRHNDCTCNLVATMRALENRGLGRAQRMGVRSGRPDYTWHPSPKGIAVAEALSRA